MVQVWFSALLRVLLMGESLLPPIEEVKLTGPYVRTYTGNFVVSACEEFTGGGRAGCCEIRDAHVSLRSFSATEVCLLSSRHPGYGFSSLVSCFQKLHPNRPMLWAVPSPPFPSELQVCCHVLFPSLLSSCDTLSYELLFLWFSQPLRTQIIVFRFTF